MSLEQRITDAFIRVASEVKLKPTKSAAETITGPWEFTTAPTITGKSIWHTGNFDPANYAPVSGSANYVQVSPASAQSGNVWMNGTAIFGNSIMASNGTSAVISSVSGIRNLSMKSYSADNNYLYSSGANLIVGTSDLNPLHFYTNNIQRVSISSGGNVSISTTTASSSTSTGALTVAGGLGVAGNSYFGGNLNIGSSPLAHRFAVNVGTGLNFSVSNLANTSVRLGVFNDVGSDIAMTLTASVVDVLSSQASPLSITRSLTANNNTSIAFNQLLGTAYVGVNASGDFAFNISADLTTPKFSVTRSGVVKSTNAIFTDLTDYYVPYHRSDTLGLLNTSLYYNGTNFGIDTISPTGKFHVYKNTITPDAGDELIVLEQAGTGDVGIDFLFPGVRRWRIGVDNDDADKFKIANSSSFANNSLFTLDTSGNAGIGVAAPTTKLDVSGIIRGDRYRTNLPGTADFVAYYMEGDSNTGMFSPATDTIGFSTAGVQRVRIDNVGNVGIGNTPAYTLDVTGQIRATSTVRTASYFYSYTASTGNKFISNSAGPNYMGILGSAINANANSTFSIGYTADSNTNITPVLTVTDQSRVGIGTTSPSSKLHISTSTWAEHIQLTRGSINGYITLGSTDGLYLGADSASTNMLAILKNGNVGIGVVTPDYKLDVTGSGNTTLQVRNSELTDGSFAELKLIPSTASNSYFGGTIRFLRDSVNGSRLGISATTSSAFTERISVRADTGFVGIGTASPGSILHLVKTGAEAELRIQSDTTNNATVNFTENANVDGFKLSYISASNRFDFIPRESSVDTTPAMTILRTGGNIGMGYSSGTEITNNKLAVNGSGYFNSGITTNTGVAAKFLIATSATNDASEIRTGAGTFKIFSGRYSSLHQSIELATGDNYTSGATRIFIQPGGNVGIGYSSGNAIDTYKLAVAGSIFANSKGVFTMEVSSTHTTGYSIYRAKNDSGDFYVGIDNSTGTGLLNAGESSAYARVLNTNTSYPLYLAVNNNKVLTLSNDKSATFAGSVTATQFISNIAIGTAPFTVTSTTKVNNLNVDMLDGLHSTDFALAGHNHAGVYLTSETDPVYTASSWYSTVNNSANWNTAYGWGNHAGLYALLNHNHDATYQEKLPLPASATFNKYLRYSNGAFSWSTMGMLTLDAAFWDTLNGTTHDYVISRVYTEDGMIYGVSYKDLATAGYVTGTPWRSEGYLTGITGGMVNSALGYTPLNSASISGWALAPSKPTYTAAEVGAAPSSTVSFPGFAGTIGYLGTASTAARSDHGHSNVWNGGYVGMLNTSYYGVLHYSDFTYNAGIYSLTKDANPTSGSSNPVTSGGVYSQLLGKQATLVSGTNIKTVNGNSLLGAGDITISASVPTASATVLGGVKTGSSPAAGTIALSMYNEYAYVALNSSAIEYVFTGTNITSHKHDTLYAALAGNTSQAFGAQRINLPNGAYIEVQNSGDIYISPAAGKRVIVNGEIQATSFYKP